ncbi:MAG: general stress protein [Nocardioidaceae bacterium]
MPRMPQQSMQPPSGVTVGTYEQYEGAQRAVDFLSDEGFPVENVTIVGNGLRMVERVTGRLDRNKAAAAGAAGGAWWGLFIGVMLSLFSSGKTNVIALVALTVIAGAVFGAIMGMIGYAMTGGRRDFTSTSSVIATSYDVLCKYAHAEDAKTLLARLSLRG